VPTTFDAFRDQLEYLVRVIHSALGADEDWPGVLFVEDVEGIRVGGVFPVAGLTDEGKRVLAEARRHSARRSAFVMAAWRHGDVDVECLLLPADRELLD
jgi:hypothetical protein